MQDEINEKTIALYIKTGKLTAQTLQKAMKTLLAQMKKQKDKTPQGKQTLKQLKAGETISLVDLANAVKADKERGKAKPEKKPSIRAQLLADKEKAQKKPAKQKSQDLERS